MEHPHNLIVVMTNQVVKSSYTFVNFTLILATPWLFAFIALGKHADTELQKALSCPGFGKLTVY